VAFLKGIFAENPPQTQESRHAITALLVSLRLGDTNSTLLDVTAGLAARFQANVEGLAPCQPVRLANDEIYLASDLAIEDRETRLKQIAEAERAFRESMNGATSVSWYADITLTNLARAAASRSRAHDMIVTGDGPHRRWRPRFHRCAWATSLCRPAALS
jgi:hypothetical protein